MTETPVRRHFVSQRVAWTARRISLPSGIRFVSAFGEARVLPLERSELPTDEQMAAASERQLEDWLVHSRRSFTPKLTAVERALLERLAEVGGRYTFRPDGSSTLAYRIFDDGIPATLLSLQAKWLVTIDVRGTQNVTQPDATTRYTAVTAQITALGLEVLSEGPA